MGDNKTRGYWTTLPNGARVHMRGRLGPHCIQCADVGSNLCDWPIAEGKTCDKPLCDQHANLVAPDTHYCAGHHQQFKEFEAAGGVQHYLENIVPFKPGER